MDVITVSQALKRSEGELIVAMRGRLIDTKKPFSGEKDGEPFTFQVGTLQDEQDPRAKIKIKVWNKPDIGAMKGKTLYLLSTRGEGKKSNTWFGVKRTVDTYQGANTPMVDCSGKADVTTQDPDGGEAQPENQPPARAPQGRQQAGAGKPSQGSGPAPGAPQGKPAPQNYAAGVKDAREKLGKLANLYILCMKAADHVAAEYERMHGIPMPAEHYQGATHSIFIECNKQYLSGALPPGDLSKYLPKPKPEQGAAR